MNKPIRIGVIGLGFGQHHVRTLANMTDADLVAVADINLDAAGGLDAYAAKYSAQAYPDGVQMMAEAGLDAVSICTSPKYRAPLIEYAAIHGIPMFIEKPWATNLAHAQQLAGICRQHEAIAMPAFSFRYHPAIITLQDLVKGDLGAGWMLNGSYVFSWLPPADAWLWDPENGNGYFNENSCHLFDAVCSLLGDPVSVMAEAINPQARPSETAAAVTMRFANGSIAALTIGGVGASAFHDYPRIDLITENGQAHLIGRDHIWERLTWSTRTDDAVHTLTLSPEGLGNTRYTHALQHFLDCVRSGERPSINVEDGVKSVALAMAVYEAARTGKKIDIHW